MEEHKSGCLFREHNHIHHHPKGCTCKCTCNASTPRQPLSEVWCLSIAFSSYKGIAQVMEFVCKIMLGDADVWGSNNSSQINLKGHSLTVIGDKVRVFTVFGGLLALREVADISPVCQPYRISS